MPPFFLCLRTQPDRLHVLLGTFAMAERSADPILRPCGPPPPIKVYESLEDLFQDICAHGQAHGYRSRVITKALWMPS